MMTSIAILLAWGRFSNLLFLRDSDVDDYEDEDGPFGYECDVANWIPKSVCHLSHDSGHGVDEGKQSGQDVGAKMEKVLMAMMDLMSTTEGMLMTKMEMMLMTKMERMLMTNLDKTDNIAQQSGALAWHREGEGR